VRSTPACESQLLAETTSLPGEAAPSRRAIHRGPGGLTAREQEIASLIAQGKSNRAMAAGLVLSERTVEDHVSRILRKLGFTSRSQIATWATRQGLGTTSSSR